MVKSGQEWAFANPWPWTIAGLAICLGQWLLVLLTGESLNLLGLACLFLGLLSAGGYVDAAPQVSFCASTSCTVTKIYDQTSNHNDLPISWGGYWKGPGPNGADIGADAMALPVTVGGHPAYGIKVTPGVGYRIDHAAGVPTGSQPEGIYMVTSSNYVNQWCCFDYGSGENSHTDTGNATMNAIRVGYRVLVR